MIGVVIWFLIVGIHGVYRAGWDVGYTHGEVDGEDRVINLYEPYSRGAGMKG